MKKFSIVAVSILITCCLILLINDNYYEGKIITDTKTKNILNTNSLTMMYETDYQSGEYQVSSDTTWPQDGYIFNERLSKCENGGVLSWDDENKKVLLQTNTSDKCFVYFDKAPNTLASYIINNVYTGVDGDNGLYYHDGVGTYGTLEAGDNSYRFSGANPNNYVCFGSNEATCPADNIYRIIGVFGDQVKLIKWDYAGINLLGSDETYYKENYFWNNSTNNNTWSQSNLNTVNLNQNYLNNIGSKWSNLIATHLWQVGGATLANLRNFNVQTAYNYEVGSNTANITYNAKIGLMYVSDYYYGATPTYWNYPGYSSNGENYDYRASINDNWMYMKNLEWTITPNTESNNMAVSIETIGNISDTYVFPDRVVGDRGAKVRPSFYLNSNVTLTGGTGTQADPYRIN